MESGTPYRTPGPVLPDNDLPQRRVLRVEPPLRRIEALKREEQDKAIRQLAGLWGYKVARIEWRPDGGVDIFFDLSR